MDSHPGAGRIQGVHHGGGQVEAPIATPGGVKVEIDMEDA